MDDTLPPKFFNGVQCCNIAKIFYPMLGAVVLEEPYSPSVL